MTPALLLTSAAYIYFSVFCMCLILSTLVYFVILQCKMHTAFKSGLQYCVQ